MSDIETVKRIHTRKGDTEDPLDNIPVEVRHPLMVRRTTGSPFGGHTEPTLRLLPLSLLDSTSPSLMNFTEEKRYLHVVMGQNDHSRGALSGCVYTEGSLG